MKLGQFFMALTMFIVAADFSGIQGDWAFQLGLPLAGLAQRSFWLVPVAMLLPSVLPRRFPSWLANGVCGVAASVLVVFPLAVFSLGARSIPFAGELRPGLHESMRAELGFPILVVYSCQGHVYFPRAYDP